MRPYFDFAFFFHVARFCLVWIIFFEDLRFQSPQDDLMIITACTDEPSVVVHPQNRLDWTSVLPILLIYSLVLPESKDLNLAFVVV